MKKLWKKSLFNIMYKTGSIVYLLFAFLFYWSCNNPSTENNTQKSYYILTGETQGTTYTIKFQANDTANVNRDILKIFDEIDYNFSIYNEHSLLSQINNSNNLFFLLDSSRAFHFMHLFTEAKYIWKITDGAFNPAIMPLVSYWGFGKNRKLPEEIDTNEIKRLIPFTNFEPAEIVCRGINDYRLMKAIPIQKYDFNAIAQGYTVDCVAEYFDKKNIENYMIEIGGEVKCKGVNPDKNIWSIGIDKPVENENARQLQAKIALNNLALATSGNYRKFYEKNGVKYAHTIDPKTGYPVQHSLLSATVITQSCARADAYATAFMVMGKDKTIEFVNKYPEENLEIYLIYSDEKGNFKTYISSGIENILQEL